MLSSCEAVVGSVSAGRAESTASSAAGAAGPQRFESGEARPVLALRRERYAQFNDTHLVEMLEEREGLRIGRETIRQWHVLCMVMREADDARD